MLQRLLLKRCSINIFFIHIKKPVYFFTYTVLKDGNKSLSDEKEVECLSAVSARVNPTTDC